MGGGAVVCLVEPISAAGQGVGMVTEDRGGVALDRLHLPDAGSYDQDGEGLVSFTTSSSSIHESCDTYTIIDQMYWSNNRIAVSSS